FALTKNPTIYVSLSEKFWQTATIRTVDNGEQEITAIVDGKEFTITEASVRRYLQLADVDEPIPNIVSSSQQKTQTPRQALNHVNELSQTSEPIPNVPDEAIYEEWDDKVVRATTTAASLDAAHASGGSPRCQEATGGSIAQTRAERLPTSPHDSPLPRVNTLGSDEGNDEKDLEDSSKQGRMIEEIDQDAGVTLVTPTHSQEDQPEDQLGVFSTAKVLADASKNVHTYTRRRRAVSTGSGGVSTASRLFSTAEESVSTAGASMPVTTAGMVQEVNIKDKGKGIIEEYEEEQSKRTKLQQEQDRIGHEAAENTRERVEADEELTQRLQAEERNKYSEDDQAKMLVDLINQRQRYFVAQKAKAKRNKPMTQAQKRNYMMNYIKHIGSHILQQLKRYYFDELKELFETTMKNVNAFIPMETEDRERASELAAGSSQATINDFAEIRSSKRAAEVGLDHEGSKKQKTNEDSESVQVKYPIIDWEVYFEDTRRDDLVKLWDLVKERFSITEPTDDKEKELWVELKRLFKLDSDDTLWKLQRERLSIVKRSSDVDVSYQAISRTTFRDGK
ncbi:hypothetical protein Tco_1522353, partial [Tanacetum coccineum]